MSMIRRITGATTVAAVLFAAVPGTARAADTRHATLEVDAAAAGEAAEVLRQRILERGALLLRKDEILPGRGSEDPTITVTVRSVGGDEPGYSFDIVVAHAGEVQSKQTAIACSLCTETELVAAVEDRLAQSADHLDAPAPAADPTPTESSASPPPPRPTDAARPTDRRALGVMGKAGIGVLSGGVVVIAVGIGLLARRPQPVSGDARYEKDTRPIGGGLLGAGVAVGIAGAVLLGLDRRHARKVALAPWWQPGRGGVTIQGRF